MSRETFEEWLNKNAKYEETSDIEDVVNAWNHQQKKINELEGESKTRMGLLTAQRMISKELEGEVENRKAQVHWKCIEIDRLEGEAERLIKRSENYLGSLDKANNYLEAEKDLNKTLTAQIELLTKCQYVDEPPCIDTDAGKWQYCHGCLNSKALLEGGE